jgi:hypothetical protein
MISRRLGSRVTSAGEVLCCSERGVWIRKAEMSTQVVRREAPPGIDFYGYLEGPVARGVMSAGGKVCATTIDAQLYPS